MRKIGMVVAILSEINELLQKLDEPKEVINESGYTVYRYNIHDNDIFVTTSGCGEIFASAATQFLITKFNVDLIVNFGVVGGLTQDMKLNACAVVESVVHYDFDTSLIDNCEKARYIDYPTIYIPTTKHLVDKAVAIEPTLKRVICASGDKFVDDKNIKMELNRLYGAEICEMESAGIVLTANRNNVECLLIKAVSDSVEGGAEEFSLMVKQTAKVCVDILLKII